MPEAVRAPKRKLAVLGVSYSSDMYPNVRHKISLLQELASPAVHFHDLGTGIFFHGAGKRGIFSRTLFVLNFVWGHIVVMCRAFWRPSNVIYITYPAPLIVLFYSLLPRKCRPRILVDAFISLYDTVVNDRQLLNESSWRARILFRLEQRAFESADVVLVDTKENAAYYSLLFNIPKPRFAELPLAIPDLSENAPADRDQTPQRFTCLFVGSMVPLQGINTILGCARLLQEEPNIHFLIVGDGQQGHLVDDYVRSHPSGNITWLDRMLSTEQLVEEISGASLCLGIFGTTSKADRVFPFKLYYYAALSKPFITRDSSCLRRTASPALLCENNARSLANRILTLYRDPGELAHCEDASIRLHECRLSRSVLRSRMASVLYMQEAGIS